MRPIRKTYTTTGAKEWIPVDYLQVPFNVGISVDLVGGATATYGLELTFNDVFDPAVTPVAVPSTLIPAGTTADAHGSLTIPCIAVRLNITAISGTVGLNLVQGLGG